MMIEMDSRHQGIQTPCCLLERVKDIAVQSVEVIECDEDAKHVII